MFNNFEMGGIGEILMISVARDIGSDASERGDDTIGGFWLRFGIMEIMEMSIADFRLGY